MQGQRFAASRRRPRSSPPWNPTRIPSGLATLVAVLVFGWGLPVAAQVVASAPHCGTSGVDLCVDLTDDSLWVVDQLSGQVCQYAVTSLPPTLSMVGQVPHTFGAAAFPTFIPRITGIAYEPVTDTLFILNRTDLTVQQMSKLGVAIGAPIVLVPSSLDPALFGLSYDAVSSTLWSLDVNAEQLVQYDTTGSILSTRIVPGINVPGSVMGESLFGAGVAANGGLVELGFGNTLDLSVARTIQIDSSGDPTGVEVDLAPIAGAVLGIARGSGSTSLFACTATAIFQVDAQQPTLLPPHFVTCSASPNGSVTLSWLNADSYQAISVVRGATVVTTLTGSATTYTDLGVPTGQLNTYTLRAFSGANTAETTCDITTGSGGRIDYLPFAGTRVHDLAYDSTNDLLYATDAQSLTGRIYVYDASTMLVVDQLDTGLVALRGIAYDSVQQQLAVSSNNTNLISLVDPVTGLVPSSFPAPTGGGASTLAFDPESNVFYYVDGGTSQLVVVDADPAGPLISTCSPPLTSGVEFAGQVADLPDGAVLLSIQSIANGTLAGFERYDEAASVCFQSIGGTAVTLDDMGASLDQPDGVTGMVKVGAEVFVASAASNTIFRLILDDTATVFIRGDADLDADLDIADIIAIANALFANNALPLSCEDAADVNDDGVLDISDPVYSIFFQFLSGTAPPGPFPDPGVDPTADLLGC